MQTKRFPGLKGRPVNVQIGENVRVSRTAMFGTGVVLEKDVVIGPQSQIGTGCKLTNTRMGRQCHIGAKSEIFGGTLEDRVTVGAESTIMGASITIATGTNIGDSVYISGLITIGQSTRIGYRTIIHSSGNESEGSLVIGHRVDIGNSCAIRAYELGTSVCIGNNVRMQDVCIIGEYTKIDHKSYIGHDARIGKWCEIGENVTVRPTTFIPDYWEVPGNSIVNPGLNSPPVVVYKTAPPRV